MGIAEDLHQGRFYDGLPSVTTILQVLHEPWLTRWRGEVGNQEADRITKEAAWLGTLFHDHVTVAEMTQTPLTADTVDPLLRHAVTAYRQWRDHTLDTWVQFEVPVVSRLLGFGGTPDRVGVLKGDAPDKRTLVDLKTGGYSAKHRLQTVAYMMLLGEAGLPVSRRATLYIPKDPQHGTHVVAHWHTSHNQDRAAFTHCLWLYHWLKTV